MATRTQIQKTRRPTVVEASGRPADLGAALLLASGPHWAMAHQALSVLMLAQVGPRGGGGLSAGPYFNQPGGDGCPECENPCEPELCGSVAVVELCGPITPAAEQLRCYGIEACSLEDLADGLEEAAADPAAASILLKINSPGGALAGISDFMGILARVQEIKPVVAALGGSCGSLACWISCGCTAVHCSPETVGGSIGVFAVVEDSSKMYDAMGVRRMVIGSGPYKGAGLPGIPISEEQVAEIQRSVDAINTLFIEGIAAGRGMSVEAARALATGASIIGKDLVTDGLADSVLTPREVLEAMQNR